jgi:hypothetical protein
MTGDMTGKTARKVRYIEDDPCGEFFLFGEEFGPRVLVRASSLEAAYEEFINEEHTIPESEVCEAYGFRSQEEFDSAIGESGVVELVEGYEYQGSSSGTGIVSVSPHLWIMEVPDSEHQVRLTYGDDGEFILAEVLS